MTSHLQEALHLYFSQHSVAGPLAFVGLRILSVVVAPIPGAILDLAAVAAFGVTRAFLLSEMGILLGAAAAFGIARRHRERLLSYLARRAPSKMARLRAWEGKLGRVGGLGGWIAIRLPSDPAYDWICYGAGLTQVSWRVFMASTFIGSLPSMIVFFYFANIALAGSLVRGAGILIILVIVALLLARSSGVNSDSSASGPRP